MGLCRRLAMLLFVLFVAPAWPVAAQTQGELSLARKFYQEGLSKEKAKQWSEAIAAYRKAIAIKPTPQLQLRVAVCLESDGQLSNALVDYERGLEQAKLDKNSKATKLLQQRLDALRPRVPTLTLVVAGDYADLDVELDGEPITAATLGSALPIDPGEHVVTAKATGHAPMEKKVSVAEGDRSELPIALQADPNAAEPSGGDEPDAVTSSGGDANYIPGAVLLGGGAVALGIGIALFVVQSGKESDVDDLCGGPERLTCPASRQDEVNDELSSAETLRTVSFIVGGIGAAATVAGVILLIIPPTSAETVSVLPTIGPTFAGVSASMRF